MEYTDKEYCLEVKGDFACFTRPELKVERVSYDVITPSAARAIFEAILFKKYAMRWEITRIDVLNPINGFQYAGTKLEHWRLSEANLYLLRKSASREIL